MLPGGKKLRRKKPKVKRHLGFNIVLDIINPQLKKRFKAPEAKNITEIVPGKHYVFTSRAEGKEFIFRIKKNIVHKAGPLPRSIKWAKLVELERKEHLCPEALLCLVQGIEFDPTARIL